MRRSFIVALLLVMLFAAVGALRAQDPAFDLERIQRATVFVMQARDTGDRLDVVCVGTGTLVSRDGLILTNAHNSLPNRACAGETLVIALGIRLDEPPVPQYRAEVIQADAGLDLALLRITRSNDGRLIEPGTLSLPFVELGDSSQVRLDQTITVVGYPGIGDDPISVVRGTVGGFVAEPSAPRGADQAWIKTSAAIPGTMSGGGAYNAEGQLIGIPTTAPVTGDAGTRACIADTNGDRLVNPSDICVPLGDAINSLRPANFARSLLRAAALGLTVEKLTNPPAAADVTGRPTFSRLIFAPSVNEAGQPTTVLRSLPAGSTSLYLFFDYENMTPETVYALRVTVDGIPNPTFSLAPVRWSGGASGLWYLGSNTQPWPNGVYEFTLFADGVAADSQRLVVGGAAQETPLFSDVAFGLIDLQGDLMGDAFVVPTGNTAYARFVFRNMTDGMPWTAIWYYNDAVVFRTPDDNPWTDGPTGTKVIPIQADSGLLPGSYRLELYIEDRLSATSDFVVAGAQEGAFARIFTDLHFTSAATPEEARTAAPITSFAAGADAIYSVFGWQFIAPGTPWTVRWMVDDDVFYEQTLPWVGAENGDAYLTRLTAPGGVPDGTYRMELFISNVQFASVEARVGIGQLPIDQLAVTTGAQMRGRILDAETGRGIPGATFVLISDQFSVADFTWDEEQIYALSVTDENGSFEIDRLLEFSTEDVAVPYSAIIVAQGYLPVSADGIEITVEDENPLELTIYLTRD